MDHPGAKRIPIFRPRFGEAELQALREVFGSGWLGPGPVVERFESAFARRVNAPHAVAVNSGTAALHLACRALGLGPGDQVLVPALTFVSTAHAAAYCGAGVVFVDVEESTCNIDLDDLVRKITPSSRAVIAVHYGGRPVALQQCAEIARQFGLFLIEDAAHACGAIYHDHPIGDCHYSDACCFSFNAVKNLSTGDGGMVTSRSGDLASRIRKLRWMGINRGTFQRNTPSMTSPDSQNYQWEYDVEDLGFKYIMNDVGAALGLAQLRQLDENQRRRRHMARRYQHALAELEWLKLPPPLTDAVSAWHLYTVRSDYRDALRSFLAERGVATGVHYRPLHQHPFYQAQQPHVVLPVAEGLGERLLTLPFHHNLSDDEVSQVLDAVRAFAGTIAHA